MNWYKLAQLSNIEIFEDLKDHNESYISIGHNIKELPSYMWTLSNGEIISREITADEQTHTAAFPGHSFSIDYSGRFDSSTGRLSIKRPGTGPAHFRPVPKSILFKLYQKFPRIKQIYVF